MIYPNQSARSYQFRGNATLSKTRTDTSQNICGGVRLDIGFGGTLELYAYIVSVYDVGDATGRYKAMIYDSDLGITHTTTGSGWNDLLKMRIEMDDAVLTADCEDWQLDCGDVRFYIQLGAGAETLLYTKSGPLSVSGGGFDPRMNVCRVTPIQKLGDETTELEVLPGYPDHLGDTTYRVTNSWLGGWKYDSTKPGAAVDELPAPPDVDCDDCVRGLVDIVLDTPPDTWAVTGTAEAKYDRNLTDLGNFNVWCDTNHTIGSPGVVQVDKVELTYYRDRIFVDLNPDDCTLTSYEKEAGAKCDIDPEAAYTVLGPSTGTVTPVCMAFSKEVQSLYAYLHYATIVSAASCPSRGPEDPPYVSDTDAPSGSELCWYEAYGTYEHAEPLCGADDTTWISYDVSPTRRHFTAYADSGSNVFVARSASSAALSFSSTNIGRVASAGCIRAAGDKLLLYLVQSGTVYEYVSDDEGQTWGAGTSIGTGTQVAAFVTPQRVRYIYVRQSDGSIDAYVRDADGNSLKTQANAIASGADDSPMSIIVRPLADGESEWVLTYLATTNITERSSPDGVTFGGAATGSASGQLADTVSPSRVRYLYRRSGSAIVGKVLDAAGNVLVADTTVIASGVDSAPIDVETRPLASGGTQVVLMFISGGSTVIRYSPDGLTFT
jgi:hypothetical protein